MHMLSTNHDMKREVFGELYTDSGTIEKQYFEMTTSVNFFLFVTGVILHTYKSTSKLYNYISRIACIKLE